METVLKIQSCIAQLPYINYTGTPVSLNIKRGEIVSILGPDYSGKMEWLRTFAGLSEPVHGDVLYETVSTRCQSRREWEQLRRKLGYVSSGTSLLSATSGLANVMLPAKYHQLDEQQALRNQAMSLMVELEVQNQHNVLPAAMRRDQRYRLALARALMLNPEVLVLENPFIHSDAAGSRKLKEFFLTQAKVHNTALLIMSHDIDFSLKHAQQIIFVSGEQVYCFSSTEQFFASEISSIRKYLDQPGIR
jgi:ABC-type transporter Mla maintaining outer membrane lipid asymmetry ATPase subunit MlaF